MKRIATYSVEGEGLLSPLLGHFCGFVCEESGLV